MVLPIDTTTGENLDRIVRIFARFTTVGYVAYSVMLVGSVIAWSDRTAPWWTSVAVVLAFGTGLVPGVLSFRDDVRAVRWSGAVAASAFLVVVASFPFAWNGTGVPMGDGVWFASFPGLASIAAVIAWPARVAFAHMVIGCVAVQMINVWVRDGATLFDLVPETGFAVMFCSLFVGGSVMALRTGRVLDTTTAQTHAVAEAAASQRGRMVERERFDALTHDSVMATLLVASRSASTDEISALAKATLTELDDVRAGVRTDRPFTVDEAVVHLRAAAADANVRAEFVVRSFDADGKMPADAVWALGAAVSEALRNTVRHAGPAATSRVEVTGEVGQMTIRVSDDGVGFDPTAIASHRLGVAVSIRGRLESLPGGEADVVSRVGHGTTVTLTWRDDIEGG
ncbi:sensor histidine kinase [Gordonia malaquae]|uniref:sensor histidine kinase n=1 Tax=Gordonia malaquae TaxID=410332 RepID=UPI0030C7992C